MEFMATEISQQPLKESLDDLRLKIQKDQETELKSDLLANMAIENALDSIRRVEELVNVRSS